LAAFKELLEEAFAQQRALRTELEDIRPKAEKALATFESWRDGWLLRRLMAGRFKRLEADSHEREQDLRELEQDLEGSLVPLDLSMSGEHEAAYEAFCEAFQALAQSEAIWDTLSERRIDKRIERTVADHSITRSRVSFTAASTDFFATPFQVPCMENRNGGHLYFYPGFLLYSESRQSFAVLALSDVRLELARVQFHETERIPSDSPTIGQTWLKANIDGSPDRRFKGNTAIPIVEYGQLGWLSSSGLNERYMISHYGRCQAFDNAWERLRKVFANAT
jgi:hypothetical protein